MIKTILRTDSGSFKMKIKNKIILPLLAIASITFTSCEKDVLETNEAPNVQPYTSLQDFYTEHAVGFQEFQFNPAEDALIVGDSGTMIGIPANSLVDNNGLPPTGMVTATMKEIYDIKSMVLTHTPTTSNGVILQSGGMFYLQFTANNISYKPDTVLGGLMPADTVVTGMHVYYGQQDLNNGMNWEVDLNFAVVESLYTHAFSFDSLGHGWIQIAKEDSVVNPVDVEITPTVNAERGETVDMVVYLVLPSIKSVMNVANTSMLQSINVNALPSGMQAAAVIIGVGRITGKAYFGKTNFTVSSLQNINIDVTQRTDQEIQDLLSGF
jgi:hypothetical protein